MKSAQATRRRVWIRHVLRAVAAIIPRILSAQNASSNAPPPAYSVGAALDPARSRLVVFGGFQGSGYVGDTWEWDGAVWKRFGAAGPPARNAPFLVYDGARRNIVMFGGDTRTTGSLADTWTFDGTEWKRVATAGPSPRSTHAMVYDTRRQRVVLFGGSDGQTMLGDTWEWDGARWAQVATTGPSARTLFGLAYDSVRGRTVLFGGTSALAPDAPSLGDTWEWDGTRWTRIEITGPSARDHLAMAYDPVRRVVVLHGGGSDDAAHETWTYDGRAWTRASTTGPIRRFARLAYDSNSQSVLLYGGFDRQPSNELWRFDAAGWSRMFPR